MSEASNYYIDRTPDILEESRGGLRAYSIRDDMLRKLQGRKEEKENEQA